VKKDGVKERVPTKERILSAATELFAAHGYEGTKTRNIAKKASVNEGTIYNNFRSKKRLYREALEWNVHKLALSSFPEAADNSLTLIKQLVEAREQAPEISRQFLFAALENSPEYSKILDYWRKNFLDRLIETVERQKRQGVVAKDVPSTLAAITLQALCYYCWLFFDLFQIDSVLEISRDDLIEFYDRVWRYGTSQERPAKPTSVSG
jgi:AcrR family transcriptional regulator